MRGCYPLSQWIHQVQARASDPHPEVHFTQSNAVGSSRGNFTLRGYIPRPVATYMAGESVSTFLSSCQTETTYAALFDTNLSYTTLPDVASYNEWINYQRVSLPWRLIF